MRLPDKRNARAGVPGVSEGNPFPLEERPSAINESPDQRHQKPLIDKFGNAHSEAIFTNWSPQMLRIMGIRRLDEKGGAG
jgi:hypothetical protein